MDNIFNKKNCFKEIEGVASLLEYGNYDETPKPVVSIIMPVYKRPDTFIHSLKSAINQDFNFPYEIVVVDNYDGKGESPNLEVVKQMGAKNVMYYHNSKNLGMYGNWNRGIELARAEFITYCHDDDLLLPNCLKRLMELQKIAGRKCILSTWNTIDEKGNYIYQEVFPYHRCKGFMILRDHYNYTLYDQFLGSQGYGVGCLFNRQCMLDIGGYNIDYYPSADYALHTCYTFHWGCIMNNVPTFNYRISLNESFAIYKMFVERDKFFRQCMMAKIKLPVWWLEMVDEAIFRIKKYQHTVQWGGEDSSLCRKIKRKDWFIFKLAMLYHNTKKYSVSFKINRG